jgi:hypothetical protein
MRRHCQIARISALFAALAAMTVTATSRTGARQLARSVHALPGSVPSLSAAARQKEGREFSPAGDSLT